MYHTFEIQNENALCEHSNKTNVYIYIYVCVCLAGCATLGYYGESCSLPCPQNCQENRCDIVDGNCLGCVKGYRGPTCNESKQKVLHQVVLSYGSSLRSRKHTTQWFYWESVH